MNVVPAQIAVPSLAVASPPQRENTGVFAGFPHPTILAACALLGVDEVYAVGGARAVAAFAYGFEDEGTSCEPVSLVTGPGNIYVTAAKRLLKGLIGIDAEAGTTEIAMPPTTAPTPSTSPPTSSARPSTTYAASVLVTDSDRLAADVAALGAGSRRPSTPSGPHGLSGKQSGVVLVDDIDAGLDVVNAYAAEHLEIQTRDAGIAAARRNAGCLRGAYSPGQPRRLRGRLQPRAPDRRLRVPQQRTVRADLPARHPRRALRRGRPARRRAPRRHLATAEDLPAHGEAVTARFGDAL